MDSPAMINFPLPMLTALLCGMLAVLVWRLDLGIARASAMFSALLALCTVQALLVGLRFGYGMSGLIPLQRTLPLFFGPLMYLCFAALTVDTRGFARRAGVHLCAPVVFLVLFWASFSDLRHLDLMISLSYLFYCIALFRLWRKGPDALIYARVDVTETLSNWTLRSVALLAFVLILDTVIALDFQLNQGANAPALISYGMLPLIALLFALLITVPKIKSQARETKPAPSGSSDAQVAEKLNALMEDEQLFLDHQLSVQRMARRLHLPARDVSSAINRTYGANASQYVNEFRLKFAADLLVKSDDSVGLIAERSGFLSRSNFYREFQRVYGQSPSAFRSDQGKT
jgi:AraC-like DNA-binding protein